MKRIWYFFIFVALFAAAFHAGGESTLTQEDAKAFMDEFEELIADIDGIGIFLHNMSLTLVMFIPGAGAAWGLVVAWSTGHAFAAIATLSPEITIPPLAALFLTPFGILEVATYAMATSRSCILALYLARRQSLRPLIKPTLIEIGIAAVLLLVGGLIEFYAIESVRQEFGDISLTG